MKFQAKYKNKINANVLIFIIILLMIGLYFIDFPIFTKVFGAIFIFIVLVQWLIFSFINRKKINVEELEILGEEIKLKFPKNQLKSVKILRISDLEIHLSEQYNHKSFFIGIDMKIKEKNKPIYYLLSSENWQNQDLEAIFLQLKSLKKEEISSEEMETLHQLRM